MIRREVARASLVPVFPGKYAVDNTNSTRLSALLELAGPTSAASHQTAAWIHGFDGFHKEPPPEITVLYRSTFHPKGVHRTRNLEAVDIVLVGNLRVTSPARTLSDLALLLTRDELELAVESALRSKKPTEPANWHEKVLDRLVELAQWNRPGHANLRAVLTARPRGCRPTGSSYETAALQAFRKVGLGDLLRQPSLSILDPATRRNTTVYPDFGCFVTGTVVEVDGEAYHRERRSAERRRDNLISSAVRVLRFDSETPIPMIANEVRAVINQRMKQPWPDPDWQVTRGNSAMTIRLPAE